MKNTTLPFFVLSRIERTFQFYFQSISNYFETAFHWLRETALLQVAPQADERFPVAG